MKKGLYKGGMCVIASLFLFSCGGKNEVKIEDPLVGVSVVADANSALHQTFTGKTKSAQDVNLAFRVSGQIARVLVSEGDYVKKGQVVAEMDSRDYQVQLNATEAEYEQIKADAERVIALYQEGNTTASNYDKARYGLQQITQKLSNHRNQLADTKLRSTMSGYVQTKLHESGETVSAGMPVVSLFSKENTEVEIKLSATDFANIHDYTSFVCKFDVTGDETFPLEIARTSQEANSSQLYAVRLRFKGEMNKMITPGMTTVVYAEVNEGKASGIVNVPSTALLSNGDKVQVFVYDQKTGIVSKREVNVTALHRNGSCDIDDGLSVGERVVSTGVHHVKDGQKVRLLEKTSKSNVGGLL